MRKTSTCHSPMPLLENLLRLARQVLHSDSTEMDDTVEKPLLNLLRGHPNTSLLPVDLIKDAVNYVLSDTSIAYPGLLYGPDPGYEPCREAIAAWLTSFYEQSVRPENICITGGASQSLGCMLNVFTDPEYTRNVWLVAPAYMLVFRIFEDAGFAKKMRAVPEDEEGIDIAYLRKEIQKSEERARGHGNTGPRYKPDTDRAKVYKHVIYCVPAFSNPSSRTMTLQRRRELVKLAREFDALIACDDVYDTLQWPAQLERHTAEAQAQALRRANLPRLVDIDRELEGGAERAGADGFGNAFSNGTFSKIAGPGLRTGWIDATAKFSYGISQAGIQRSGGAPSQLTSTYVTRLLVTGQIQRHIETILRPAYANRYRIMASAIKEHLLPLGFSMPQPDRDVCGGYFVWCALPKGMSATDLAQKCQAEEGVIVAPGNIFEVPGDDTIRFPSSIRLCFAWEDESRLAEAVQRIATAAKRLLESHSDGVHEYVVVDKPESADNLETFK